MGSLTRIFTTLQEVDDKLILYGFIAGFALNAVLASQMVYYWNSPAAKGKPVASKGAKKAVPAGGASPSSKATGSQRKGPTTRRRA